jgi:hypothetical protein
MKVLGWIGTLLVITTLLRLVKPKPPGNGRVAWRSLDGQLYAEPGALGLGWWTTIPDGTPFYNQAAPW